MMEAIYSYPLSGIEKQYISSAMEKLKNIHHWSVQEWITFQSRYPLDPFYDLSTFSVTN